MVVRGVQHYVKTGSNNSCDIAIAVDAMADLLLGRISNVAVLSDDTDFIWLYVAVRREWGKDGSTDGIPFLWLVSDRNSTRSTSILDFFPDTLMHFVGLSDTEVSETVTSKGMMVKTPDKSDKYAEIAEAILKESAPGTFGSTDFQPLSKQRWAETSDGEIRQCCLRQRVHEQRVAYLREFGSRDGQSKAQQISATAKTLGADNTGSSSS